MRTMTNRIVAGLTLLLLALLAAGCGGDDNPVIKLHVWQGAPSHILNNAIAEFIIEEGYEYPIEVVVQTTPVLKETLPKGEVDLNLEGWQQNVPDWYNEQLEKGNIVNLGMTFEGGPQFFMVPEWVAQEYNIRTILDLNDHWELFQDPLDPSKGVFYSCIIGWECAEINKVKLEAYGLTRHYNPISPGSGEAQEALLARAQENRQPVFSYYWAPNALLGAFDWHILEEPPYTHECWENITAASRDQSLRPVDQACAYENVPIDKLAHKGLLRKAPDVTEMLKKMVVGLEPLNDTLAWADKSEVTDSQKIATYYLQTYEDRWRSWVTPEAYEKIRKALEETPECSHQKALGPRSYFGP